MSELNERHRQEQQLERLLDQALHELPLRRAPSNLPARVLAELARRSALPWWQKSFVHWPHTARIGLLAVCSVLGAMMCLASAPMAANFDALRKLRPSFAFMGAAAETVSSLVHAVPANWLYAGLTLAAVMYALLFALSAAVYRTLYLDA